jgi:hypothetical protein
MFPDIRSIDPGMMCTISRVNCFVVGSKTARPRYVDSSSPKKQENEISWKDPKATSPEKWYKNPKVVQVKITEMNMKQKRGFDQNDRIYELLWLLFTNSLQFVCLVMIYNRMGWSSCDQYQEMENKTQVLYYLLWFTSLSMANYLPFTYV